MRVAIVGDTPTIALGGLVDLGSVPLLQDVLTRAVLDHPGETIVVDLDGVVSFDDTALGLLLAAAARAASWVVRWRSCARPTVCSPGSRRLASTGRSRSAATADIRVRSEQTAPPQMAGRPSSRAITSRCTSLVPSPISRILASRYMRETSVSSMKPYPPNTCVAVRVAATAASVE